MNTNVSGLFYVFQQKVTKGARNKILLSIQKLQSRQETLRSLEKVE